MEDLTAEIKLKVDRMWGFLDSGRRSVFVRVTSSVRV